MATKRRTKKQKEFQNKVITVIVAIGLFFCGRFTADVPLPIGEIYGSTTSQSTQTTVASEDLVVTFLDVGQADATLIQASGENMLIDAGNNIDGETVVAYLQEQGVETLDYVIATHPHADHIGGIDDVINSFAIEKIIMPNAVSTSKTFEDVLDAIDAKGLSITTPVVGDTYTLGDCTFTILGPVWDYGDEMNDWSVSIQLSHGENSFVFTGDAEEDAEGDMLSTGLDLQGDVFQVGHHGSSTSNSEDFLDAVNPKYAIISCGLDNSYGHPHDVVLDCLEKRDVTVYRTDLNGNISVHSDGINLTWTTER